MSYAHRVSFWLSNCPPLLVLLRRCFPSRNTFGASRTKRGQSLISVHSPASLDLPLYVIPCMRFFVCSEATDGLLQYTTPHGGPSLTLISSRRSNWKHGWTWRSGILTLKRSTCLRSIIITKSVDPQLASLLSACLFTPPIIFDAHKAIDGSLKSQQFPSLVRAISVSELRYDTGTAWTCRKVIRFGTKASPSQVPAR